jgi:hypothetical protein
VIRRFIDCLDTPGGHLFIALAAFLYLDLRGGYPEEWRMGVALYIMARMQGQTKASDLTLGKDG